MSDPTQGPPPQEVPEEFAAVYLAAYEQALASYDVSHDEGPHDLDEPDAGLSIVSGHGDRGAQPGDAGPTWFERLRDTQWFVPVLLAALVVLLILGAYGLGKALARQVDSEPLKADSSSETSGPFVTPGPHQQPLPGPV